MPMRVLVLACLALVDQRQHFVPSPAETLIERRVAERTLPGAVLLVVRNGKTETLRAFGDADIGQRRAMRTDTLFRLASAAKIVTTAGVLLLVDDGRLALDREVSEYLPEFRTFQVSTEQGLRPASRPLRVRDLLRHTSGYGYGNDPRQRAAYERAGIIPAGDVASWSHNFSLAEWSARLSTVPLTSDPGTRFEYGLGADLAGALIERVSRERLDEFFRKRIFRPLGMHDTGFTVSPAHAGRLAAVYRADAAGLVRIDDDLAGRFATRPKALSGGGGWDNFGAGGLLTTAPDFARFLQLLLNGGAHDNRQILSARSVEEMFVNQLADTTSPERQPGIGFGLGAAIVTRSGGYGVPSSDGLVFWSGSLNTRFWIHRAQQMVGVYFSQVEPFAHLDLMNDVMRANLPPPNPVDLELHGVLASTVKHEGRDALRLIESDDTRATGFARLKGMSLRDGRIEVDVAGRRGPHAKDDDRGFVGIAFRMAVDPLSYELIYIRPDNGRADDQLRRNRSTQYASYPNFPWQLLRKEFPGRYESYVDLESGAWTRLSIDISGSRAQLFVGGATQPALVVNDLKLPSHDGGVALWIGAGSEAFFADVRVTSR